MMRCLCRQKVHARRGSCAATLAVAALMTAAVHPAAALDKGPSIGPPNEAPPIENTGWVLAHHSFERTLTYDDRLGDWLTSAATMPLGDRVQLLPPVPDRWGLFWNKRAASTKNFEVTFNMRTLPQNKGGPEDGVLAFWLSPENFTAAYDEQAIVTVRNWTQGLNDAGLTFISNRPKFKGLGVFFLGLDNAGQLRPSVTSMLCDGSKEVKLSDLPEAKDDQTGIAQTKYVDWRQKEVEVKIKATLGGVIVGTLKVNKNAEAVEFFRFSATGKSDAKDPVKDTASWLNTFLGFSGYSGSQSILEMDMSKFEMRNFDLQQVGEDKQESGAAGGFDEMGDAEEWKKVLEGEKRYIDQKDQKEAVERLTKLLGDYVDRYNKMGEKVKSDLVWLDKRMQTLDESVGTLISSSRAVNPETGAVDAGALKEHLVGIRSLLMKDKETHDKKFEQVTRVAWSLKAKGGGVLSADGRAKVDSVAEQVASVERHVNSGGSTTSWLLFILVLAVLALGLLFLNRMRYYEKKHYI